MLHKITCMHKGPNLPTSRHIHRQAYCH